MIREYNAILLSAQGLFAYLIHDTLALHTIRNEFIVHNQYILEIITISRQNLHDEKNHIGAAIVHNHLIMAIYLERRKLASYGKREL